MRKYNNIESITSSNQ